MFVAKPAMASVADKEGEVGGHGVRQTLTREDGGHEGCKHEEEHGEEKEAGVAQDLLGFVPDPQVEQPDEEADANVGSDPQVRQDLGTDVVHTQVCRSPKVDSERTRRPRPPEAAAKAGHKLCPAPSLHETSPRP